MAEAGEVKLGVGVSCDAVSGMGNVWLDGFWLSNMTVSLSTGFLVAGTAWDWFVDSEAFPVPSTPSVSLVVESEAFAPDTPILASIADDSSCVSDRSG